MKDFANQETMKLTTWELVIAYFHLFMQRLRIAGQEGYDFDQDQDIEIMMMTNNHQEHRQEQEEHAWE